MPTVNEWWAQQDARKAAFKKTPKGRLETARLGLAQRKASARNNIENKLRSGEISLDNAIRANNSYNRVYNDAPSEMARIGNVIMRGGQVPRSTQGLH